MTEDEKLQDIQEIYQESLDELARAQGELSKNPSVAYLQRGVEVAYKDLRQPEQQFKDAINTLLVDCLEAVVKGDKKEQIEEKFGQLARFGKDSGFTRADKMVEIGDARGRGGERYAPRR
jgi:hypothetical protein